VRGKWAVPVPQTQHQKRDIASVECKRSQECSVHPARRALRLVVAPGDLSMRPENGLDSIRNSIAAGDHELGIAAETAKPLAGVRPTRAALASTAAWRCRSDSAQNRSDIPWPNARGHQRTSAEGLHSRGCSGPRRARYRSEGTYVVGSRHLSRRRRANGWHPGEGQSQGRV